jgi:DNA-binding transcriptional ArsR family regulator
MEEKTYSRYFKAFGDPTRLRILALLASGELTVNEITRKIGLSQSTISRHLGVLRDAAVVTDRRDGQQVYYSLNKVSVEDCCQGFCTVLRIPLAPGSAGRKKTKKS